MSYPPQSTRNELVECWTKFAKELEAKSPIYFHEIRSDTDNPGCVLVRYAEPLPHFVVRPYFVVRLNKVAAPPTGGAAGLPAA